MKKIVIIVLSLILLAGCNNDSKIEVNKNKFLSYEEETIFEQDTYYLDLYLNDDNQSLEVTGKLIYIVKEDTDVLNIRFYPRERNQGNFDLEYVMINQIEKNTSFDSVNQSLLSVSLDETASEGDTIEIDFNYTFSYWIGEGRISYYEDYYISMFFYPFVQPNNEEPISDYNYAYNGESYYNEIGNYYASINVPKDYIVASSGKQMDEATTLRRKVYDVYLEDGRDFSFSASKNYQVYERSEYGIDYTVYSIRELSNQELEESFETIGGSINTYSGYLGEYPYDYFNLELGYIYGMESTGIIYCSQEISVYTIVHEVAHQWLYSIIHNDQAKEPFLDESLTTYITFLYFYETYGIEHAKGFLDSRSSLKDGFEDYFREFEGRSLTDDIHGYQTGYAYIIYYHGPTLFRYYFEEILGDENYVQLKSFLQAYYQEYAFKEVTIIEMLELLEETTEVAGTKDWFLEEMNELKVPEPLN